MGIASEAPAFIAIAASIPDAPECSTSAGASTSGVQDILNMKRHGFLTILALAMSFSVGAAQPQSEQPSGRPPTYPPRIAVVMELEPVSHFKLWLAGNLRNWPLAEYQLAQMKATLQDARTLFSEPSRSRHECHFAVGGRVCRRDQDQECRQIRWSLQKIHIGVQQLS